MVQLNKLVEKLHMKNSFLKLSIAILLITLLIGVQNIVSAQEQEEPASSDSVSQQEPTQITDDTCPESVLTKFNSYRDIFYVELEALLETNSVNTNLIARANELISLSENQILNLSASTFVNTSEEAETTTRINRACQAYSDIVLNQMTDTYFDFVIQNASRKRNFILQEKLDHINDKFVEMQNQVNEVQDALNQFDDQLPCFVEECIRS